MKIGNYDIILLIMKIFEITDKKTWNSFMEKQPFSQFLQSWQWGEFHERMGRKVWRLAVVDNANQHECESESARSKDAINCVSVNEETLEKIPLSPAFEKGEKILLAAQVIKYKLPLGQNYLYAPRGARENAKCKIQNAKLWNIFFKEIKELSKQEKSIFLRFEPMEEVKSEESKIIKWKVNKVNSVQPENEWLLDLEKTEDELLNEMQQKTRYNIRLAQKKGIKIKCDNEEKYFEEFWELISKTYDRKDIRTHTKKYYKGILDVNEKVELWIAEYDGKVIAGNLMSYFGDTATYMHGGADYGMRNLMAPYLLQWEIIKDAKKKGYKYYDFGGISEIKAEWEGITKFKKGFSGFKLDYGGTYEVAFSGAKYGLYKIIKELKWQRS